MSYRVPCFGVFLLLMPVFFTRHFIFGFPLLTEDRIHLFILTVCWVWMKWNLIHMFVPFILGPCLVRFYQNELIRQVKHLCNCRISISSLLMTSTTCVFWAWSPWQFFCSSRWLEWSGSPRWGHPTHFILCDGLLSAIDHNVCCLSLVSDPDFILHSTLGLLCKLLCGDSNPCWSWKTSCGGLWIPR